MTTSSEDDEQSKPAPDFLQIALKKLGVAGDQAVAIGHTPYDAQQAGSAGMTTTGLLRGGCTEVDLRQGGRAAVYPGPAALPVCFGAALLVPSLTCRSDATL